MRDATTGLTLAPHAVNLRREEGALRMTSHVALDPVVSRTLDWLHNWAAAAPERVFLAERSGDGWREVGFAEALDRVRAIATALATRGLGAETPIAILSGNSVDHALLSFAAQYAGVPTVPLSRL